MPDPIARKRLKKKMLDRWENEGGSLAADPPSPDDAKPITKDKREKKLLLASNDNTTVGVPGSPTKRRKPTRK